MNKAYNNNNSDIKFSWYLFGSVTICNPLLKKSLSPFHSYLWEGWANLWRFLFYNIVYTYILSENASE